MKITITLHCPDCQSTKIKKSGRKISRKQNYLRKAWVVSLLAIMPSIQKILMMLVRCMGIRDIAAIERKSASKSIVGINRIPTSDSA
jgi:transposase-like protein